MEIKKSAVDLSELAMGIVLIGIVVGVGANIMINFRDSRLTSALTYQIANESVIANDTGVLLSTQWVRGIDSILNATGSTSAQVASSDYSLSVDSVGGVGTISNLTGSNPDGFNVTYTVYNLSDPQWSLPNETAIGLAEYGNWFKILVIVGIAAVVLGLIFITFGNKKEAGVNF